MSDKLKPCPFCGGEAVLTNGWFSGERRVECLDCGVMTKIEFSENPLVTASEQAIKAWNRRAEQ